MQISQKKFDEFSGKYNKSTSWLNCKNICFIKPKKNTLFNLDLESTKIIFSNPKPKYFQFSYKIHFCRFTCMYCKPPSVYQITVSVIQSTYISTKNIFILLHMYPT